MADRRPLASRQNPLAGRAARWLAERGIRPNRISQGSIVFAALGAAAFALSAAGGAGPAAALLVIAALACQFRLLCNLLDGMVAIEGGLSEPDGPYWNEAPDRIADFLFLTGAGIAAGVPWLGLAAGAMAILTAYIRELGRAEGLDSDFSGPMAKPQRMAALTIGALLGAVEALAFGSSIALTLALAVIALGAAWTAAARSKRLIDTMNTGA
ncbi:CDP-alcohol phosphatidyltransferase family protein [Ovoidimarina sediminis]|uniref:CDP-alcohol phosphatidyltransferase family protein n=1 Tax=Ovoidimarina sediminis TaxID=3079856 RepID=UPI00290BD4CA|nr:CDP-alcohol phosphatidyltransferase family protein [Rhodophyticola sp. MJ-SS7]MDU8943929.1 CDP-alcohol phosphatidyltransferase family protein [Rhodophyticola sp. MJ-SS7]